MTLDPLSINSGSRGNTFFGLARRDIFTIMTSSSVGKLLPVTRRQIRSKQHNVSTFYIPRKIFTDINGDCIIDHCTREYHWVFVIRTDETSRGDGRGDGDGRGHEGEDGDQV